jgi:hypothetical protein
MTFSITYIKTESPLLRRMHATRVLVETKKQRKEGGRKKENGKGNRRHILGYQPIKFLIDISLTINRLVEAYHIVVCL